MAKPLVLSSYPPLETLHTCVVHGNEIRRSGSIDRHTRIDYGHTIHGLCCRDHSRCRCGCGTVSKGSVVVDKQLAPQRGITEDLLRNHIRRSVRIARVDANESRFRRLAVKRTVRIDH